MSKKNVDELQLALIEVSKKLHKIKSKLKKYEAQNWLRKISIDDWIDVSIGNIEKIYFSLRIDKQEKTHKVN